MNKVVFLLLSLISFSQELELRIDVDSLYYKNTKHSINNNLPLIVKCKDLKNIVVFPLIFEDFNFIFDKKYENFTIKQICDEEEIYLPFLFVEDDGGNLIKIDTYPPPYAIPYGKSENVQKPSKYNFIELTYNQYFNILKNVNFPYNIHIDGSKSDFIFEKSRKYSLWIEFYISEKFYEKNFSKEQISKWKKEGYKLFTGTLKSNKVRIYNIEELICK